MDSYLTLHGRDQLFRVVAATVFEDQLDLFDIPDILCGLALHNHDVHLLSNFERTNAAGYFQKLRAIQAGNLNGLFRRKSRLDQDFQFALVCKSSDNRFENAVRACQ